MTTLENAPAHRNTQAIEQGKKKDQLRNLLANSRAALEQAIPKHLSVDRLLRIALTAVLKDPKLLQCDSRTILLSVMNAAQAGLEPNTISQEGWLVPYRNNKLGIMECQFMPGYRGLLKLARQSGMVAGIEAHNVYKNEVFELRFGIDPVLKHEPILEGERGEFRLSYAIGRFKDPTLQPVIEVMSRDQIEKIRQRSKSGDSGPWKTDYEEMCKKTVYRRICKVLPASAQLQNALELVDRISEGRSQIEASETGALVALDLPPASEEEQIDPETGEILPPDEPALDESAMTPGDVSTHQGHTPPKGQQTSAF